MLRHDDGLFGGVGLLTDRDWTLLGRANELVDGSMVLADHPSNQQWAVWMQNLVQFSFWFLDFKCRDAYDADAYKGVKTGSWQLSPLIRIMPWDSSKVGFMQSREKIQGK